MENNTIISGASTILSATATGVQPDDVFRWIGLIITILCGLSTLVSAIYSWYKNAKKDGKITKDEAKDLVDKVSNITKDTIDKIDNKEKKDDK